MMNGSNYSLSDIAAATGSNNRANDMWGGDGFSLIWLVLIFARSEEHTSELQSH